jgi:protein SCO1/2
MFMMMRIPCKILIDMKIMKPIFYAFFAGVSLFFLTDCSSNGTSADHQLPILGRVDYVEKRVDDKIVIDTVYHQVADFQFVDQDSTLITPETFENKIYVTDFFFTSCPTICPVMKKQMLRIYEAFEDNNEVALLSHTIDPEYDTVALLHEYAQRLGVKSDKWHFVTGEKDAIYEVAQKSYMVTADEDSNAPGGFIHSGAFILVDKDRRIRGIYDGTKPEEVDQLMQDMRRLLQAYSNTEV